MKIKWTSKAFSDLTRLYEFLASSNVPTALKVVDSLSLAPEKLLDHPRMGERLEEFEPREVRRLLVGRYEIRYEICGNSLNIIRIWHTREQRYF